MILNFGKLLTKNVETGELNYPADLKNPFTGGDITTAYLSTETWSQKFDLLFAYTYNVRCLDARQ